MIETDKKIKYILIFLIVLLLLSTFTLLYYQKIRYKDTYFKYNGFEVHKIKEQNAQFYQIKLFLGNNPQPYLINVREDPRQLESISIEKNIKDKIIKKELYITMNNTATSISVLAATEISKITGSQYFFNLPTHGALTSKIEGKNITIKTCSDVSNITSIILFEKENQTRIYSRADCVIISAPTEYDLIKGANRLSLTLLKIMKE